MSMQINLRKCLGYAQEKVGSRGGVQSWGGCMSVLMRPPSSSPFLTLVMRAVKPPLNSVSGSDKFFRDRSGTA
eukprot:1157610-Pelagomonas_calceolata.AAC.5